MPLRRWLLGPALALAIVQSLGHAHCAWMSVAAACPMKVVAPESPAPIAASPAASHGHDCCGHADEASAVAPAFPVAPDSPAAAPASHGECDCPCMHQPAATPVVAVPLSAPSFARELAVTSTATATPVAALERTLACVSPVDAPPLSAPAIERAIPRGPPASA